MVTTGFRHFKH